MAKVGGDAGMAGGTEGGDDAKEVEGADEVKGAGMAMDADGAEGDAGMAEVTFVPVGAKEACEEARVAEGGIEGIEEWCMRKRRCLGIRVSEFNVVVHPVNQRVVVT